MAWPLDGGRRVSPAREKGLTAGRGRGYLAHLSVASLSPLMSPLMSVVLSLGLTRFVLDDLGSQASAA